MMIMLKADPTNRHHAAEDFENISVFDFVVWQIAAGTHLINLSYAHKPPNARQPGIPENRLIGGIHPIERTKLDSTNRHHPHLTGERLILFSSKSTYWIH
jgi:hypothetical protein